MYVCIEYIYIDVYGLGLRVRGLGLSKCCSPKGPRTQLLGPFKRISMYIYRDK